MFSPHGKLFCTRARDVRNGGCYHVRLWETASGKPLGAELATIFAGYDAPAVVHKLPQNALARNVVCFSPDGGTLLIVCFDGQVRLQKEDGSAGQPLRMPRGIQTAAFHPDAKRILTVNATGEAQWWDTATGKPLEKAGTLQPRTDTLAFSPDRTLLLTSTYPDGQRNERIELRLWNPTTLKHVGEPLLHQGPVEVALFSPDSKFVVTSSVDRTARLWSSVTAAPVGEPLTHPDGIRALMFSPDSQLVLTTYGDQGVQLWDVATAKPVGGPFQHEKAVAAAQFSPDGRWVLTGSADATARLWRVPMPLQGKADRLKLWAEVNTGMELNESGTVLYLDAEKWLQRRQRLQEFERPAAP
jgi:eukaryotic-like serine/threonine-protein kinase